MKCDKNELRRLLLGSSLLFTGQRNKEIKIKYCVHHFLLTDPAARVQGSKAAECFVSISLLGGWKFTSAGHLKTTKKNEKKTGLIGIMETLYR